MAFDVKVEHTEDRLIDVKVEGDITIHTSPVLKKTLNQLFKKHSDASIRVDLSKVRFMDTSGLATLVEGLRWSRNDGGKFLLTGITDEVKDVFELAKLDGEFVMTEIQ